MKLVSEPSCARARSGCKTSLPAKTGTTRRQLREAQGETPGHPEGGSESPERLRELRRQLRACGSPRNPGATPRDSGGRGNLGETPGHPANPRGSQGQLPEGRRGNPEVFGSSSGEVRRTGQPGLRRVFWTGGGRTSARIADCPGGPARRGNRRVCTRSAERGPCISYMRGPRFMCRRCRPGRGNGLAVLCQAVADACQATDCGQGVTASALATDTEIDAGGVGTPELTSPGPFPAGLRPATAQALIRRSRECGEDEQNRGGRELDHRAKDVAGHPAEAGDSGPAQRRGDEKSEGHGGQTAYGQ